MWLRSSRVTPSLGPRSVWDEGGWRKAANCRPWSLTTRPLAALARGTFLVVFLLLRLLGSVCFPMLWRTYLPSWLPMLYVEALSMCSERAQDQQRVAPGLRRGRISQRDPLRRAGDTRFQQIDLCLPVWLFLFGWPVVGTEPRSGGYSTLPVNRGAKELPRVL